MAEFDIVDLTGDGPISARDEDALRETAALHGQLLERVLAHASELWEASEGDATSIAGDFVDAQAEALQVALRALGRQETYLAMSEPKECQYHGTDWGELVFGQPRCETCRPPFRRDLQLRGIRRAQRQIKTIMKTDDQED
jgi:hypothetical protein